MSSFLEFCYLVRRSIHTEDTLRQVEDALEQFKHHREIFRKAGVRPDGFSLPRQHSMEHYVRHIRNFGAPNGLCSSITEAKHIKAVKEPWRRSNRYDALGQMLVTNQRLDKLAASRADFNSRGMLHGTCLTDGLKRLSCTLLDDTTSGLDGSFDPVDNSQSDPDDDQAADEDGDSGVVSGPRVLASVTLARRAREYHVVIKIFL